MACVEAFLLCSLLVRSLLPDHWLVKCVSIHKPSDGCGSIHKPSAAKFRLLIKLGFDAPWLVTFRLPEPGSQAMVRFRHSLRMFDWAVLPVMLTPFIVEVAEIMIWVAEPETFVEHDEPSALCERCSNANSIGTAVANLAIGLQPVGMMFYAWYTADMTTMRHGRSVFKVPFVCAVLTSLGWTLTQLYGAFASVSPASWPCTCSFVGPHGHLLWKVRGITDRFGLDDALFSSYFLLVVIAMVAYDPPFGPIWVFWNFLILGVTALCVGGSSELWSIWCFTGIFAQWIFLTFNAVRVAGAPEDGGAMEQTPKPIGERESQKVQSSMMCDLPGALGS